MASRVAPCTFTPFPSVHVLVTSTTPEPIPGLVQGPPALHMYVPLCVDSAYHPQHTCRSMLLCGPMSVALAPQPTACRSEWHRDRPDKCSLWGLACFPQHDSLGLHIPRLGPHAPHQTPHEADTWGSMEGVQPRGVEPAVLGVTA